MKIRFLTFGILVFFQVTLFAQYKDLSKMDFEKAVLFARNSMGQYMIKDTLKFPPKIIDTISSWKGFELKLYTYKMDRDKLNKELGRDLIGRVILCNPSAEKLVKWSVNALLKCGISVNYFNVLQVLNNIKGCSGAQFPVRGIVYEDIDPQDGTNETYAFFDGVTIEGNGIKISTKKKQRVTTNQEDEYLSMTFNDIDEAILYGRVSSTTRLEYIKAFPNTDTLGKNWVNIVRIEYQKAMNCDENNLIYATIFSDLQLNNNNKDKKFHFKSDF